MNPEVKKITMKNEVLFTIDLLKGQGIPPKSGPAGMAIGAITALVPVMIVIAILGSYLNQEALVSIKQREIVILEKKIDQLSGAVESQQELEREKIHYGLCISEVNSSIGKYTQWSPVLTTLLENMPGSVVLTELSVKEDSVEKEVPKPDDPKKKIMINVPVNKLSLSVSDQGQGNCDEAVREFRDRLRSSPLLGPMLAKIDVSNRTENVEGKDITVFELSCLFKPEL
jgi:Tfp pilus assembly protein PilN